MLEILTAEQSKQADAAAMASGTPGIQLMEAAGAAVAEEIKAHAAPCPVLVLCGAGNNGGDGFVVARLLKKDGWPVRLACLVKRSALKGDAALAAMRWDGAVEDLCSNLALKDSGLIVDAVFGTGFKGALPPELVTLFDKIRAKKPLVVAIDLPSGLEATTAMAAEGTLHAAATVTFTRKKPAHVLFPAKELCGRVVLADIGISNDAIAALGCTTFENHPAIWGKAYPFPAPGGHKYDRGHVCVIGGKTRTGAACLAAAAAQRIGAGIVSITSEPESAQIYACYRASIMVDTWNTVAEFKSLLADERKNVLVLGPGLGPDRRDIADTSLSFGKSVVLDADIFSIYKNNPGALFEKTTPRHVLTPHEGEFGRLFPGLEGNKPERVKKASKTSNSIILLKGPDTVIAAPDGTTVVNASAPPSLATAGTGDVLAGLIAGLIAQGMPPFMAAAAACWLHAETARCYGLCLTAEDIIIFLNQTANNLFLLK